jgi:hypothetical protein
VASATTVARNVERAKTRHDLVPELGPGNIRTVGKLADRLNKGVLIDSGLSRSEIINGPFEDICKIELCGGAEADAPSLLGHGPYLTVLEMIFSERLLK